MPVLGSRVNCPYSLHISEGKAFLVKQNGIRRQKNVKFENPTFSKATVLRTTYVVLLVPLCLVLSFLFLFLYK